jgi:hypothetical protein
MRKFLGLMVSVFVSLVTAQAGQVRLVDPTGTQNFSSIQAAIDAAPEGGLILVAPGIYSGFSINAKSVSIVGVPGDAQAVIRVNGAIRITNSTWHPVLLSGLDARGYATYPNNEPGLVLTNNAGPIHIQDCSFTGQLGDRYTGGWFGPAATMQWNTQLSFERCRFTGAPGFYHYLQGGPGSPGASIGGTLANFESCTFQGGAGGNSEDFGGVGGAGLGLGNGSMFFLSNSTMQGGKGGDGDFAFLYQGGDGGPGIALSNGASGDALGCTLIGGLPGLGAGGSAGVPISGVGLHQISGVARTLVAPALTADAVAMLRLTFTGQPGDRVWARVGVSSDYTPSSNPLGNWLVLVPPFMTYRPLGVVPASGVLQTQVRLANVAPGILWRRYYIQGLVQPAAGAQAYLTGVNTVHVFNRDEGPDCDGNGVSDYVDVAVDPILDCNGNLVPDACDIASGTSLDLDGNGVPDECQ